MVVGPALSGTQQGNIPSGLIRNIKIPGLLKHYEFNHSNHHIVSADNQFIGRVTSLYVEVLSDDFYALRRPQLYPVVKQCHHFYFNSVAWEHSDVAWKATYADVIRCCTNNMVVAVVELVVLEETGNLDVAYEAARDIALLSATKSWSDHHQEDGTPI